MTPLNYKIIESPVGSLKIVATEKALVAILWDNEKPNRVRLNELIENPSHSLILETEKQLKEYFLRQRKVFTLPLEMSGTDFQQGVWKLLTQIPYGTTASYKDLAVKMNSPKAFRAVGTANGKNLLSIIVPCHRVIASNGNLAGFAGGVERKQILLDLETKA